MKKRKNWSRVCVYHCAQLSYTTQHRAVLIIFPLILQTSKRGVFMDQPVTQPTVAMATWLQMKSLCVYFYCFFYTFLCNPMPLRWMKIVYNYRWHSAGQTSSCCTSNSVRSKQ